MDNWSALLRCEAAYLEPPDQDEIPESYMMRKWNEALGLEGCSAEGCPRCSEPVTNSETGWIVICPKCGEVDLEEYFWEAYWDGLNDDY